MKKIYISFLFLGFSAVASAQFGYTEPVKNSEGKIGFIDKTGKLRIDFRFTDTRGFSEGIAPVCIYPECDNACWGFINTKGEWILEPQFWSALPVTDGVARVQINRKFGFIDTKGKLVIPLQYNTAGRFGDGLCFVSLSENETDYFVINTKGETIIAGPFDYYSSEFRNGKAIVSKNGDCLEIDKTGKILRKFDPSSCGQE
jgi:hypothetical protein